MSNKTLILSSGPYCMSNKTLILSSGPYCIARYLSDPLSPLLLWGIFGTDPCLLYTDSNMLVPLSDRIRFGWRNDDLFQWLATARPCPGASPQWPGQPTLDSPIKRETG